MNSIQLNRTTRHSPGSALWKSSFRIWHNRRNSTSHVQQRGHSQGRSSLESSYQRGNLKFQAQPRGRKRTTMSDYFLQKLSWEVALPPATEELPGYEEQWSHMVPRAVCRRGIFRSDLLLSQPTFSFHILLPLFNYRRRKHVPFAITGLKKNLLVRNSERRETYLAPFSSVALCSFNPSFTSKFLLCELYHHWLLLMGPLLFLTQLYSFSILPSASFSFLQV